MKMMRLCIPEHAYGEFVGALGWMFPSMAKVTDSAINFNIKCRHSTIARRMLGLINSPLSWHNIVPWNIHYCFIFYTLVVTDQYHLASQSIWSMDEVTLDINSILIHNCGTDRLHIWCICNVIMEFKLAIDSLPHQICDWMISLTEAFIVWCSFPTLLIGSDSVLCILLIFLQSIFRTEDYSCLIK